MDSEDEIPIGIQQIESSDDNVLSIRRRKCNAINSDDDSNSEIDNKSSSKLDNVNCGSEADNSLSKSHFNNRFHESKNSLEATTVSENEKECVQFSSKLKSNLATDDSDSDEELFIPIKKKIRMVNSDSEDEVSNLKDGEISQIKPVTYDSDGYDQELSDNTDANKQSQKTSTKPKIKPVTYDSDIYDQELSDDTEQTNSNEQVQEKSAKSKNKKHRAASEKARSSIVQEIYSEKQRMIRDTEISLPYHKPKQRTLREFLDRKKYTPTSKISLKMSMRDINILKDIEDRRKHIDIFYKSESEEENDAYNDENNISSENNSRSSLVPDITCCSLSIERTDQLDSSVEKVCSLKDNSSSLPAKAENELTDLRKQIKIDVTDLGEQMQIDEAVNKGTTETSKRVEQIQKDAYSEDSLIFPVNASKEKSETKNIFEDLMDTEELDLHLDSEDITEAICVKSSQSLLTPICNTPKLNVLASKFPNMDLSKIANMTPKIGMQEGGFIEFDDSPKKNSPSKKADVDAMLRRLIHSAGVKKVNQKSEIFVDIVQKEIDLNGEEKLVSSNICVKLQDQPERVVNVVPGAQLVLLKNTLRARVLKNRETVRQKRIKEKQFLDSEEVITDYQEDALLDEEQELTDQSDTDVESESEPEENDIIMDDVIKPKNAYIDDEADEDSDSGDNDVVEVDEDNNDVEANECSSDGEVLDIQSRSKFQDTFESDSDGDEIIIKPKEKKGCLIISSDDEDFNEKEHSDTENLTLFYNESMNFDNVNNKISTAVELKAELSSVQHQASKNSNDFEESFNSMDSSLELLGSVVPPHQPYGGQKKKKLSEKTSMSPPEKNMSFFTQLVNAHPIEKPDDNACEYSLSQFGDPQLPKIIVTQSKETETYDESVEDANDLDLLGLCSGTFSEIQKPQVADKPNESMDGILDLCSGVFSTQNAETQMQQEDGLSLDVPSIGSSSPTRNIPTESSADNFSCSTSKVGATRNEQNEGTCSDVMSVDNKSPDNSVEIPTAVICSSDEEGILNRQSSHKSFKRKRKVYTLSDEEIADNQSEDEIRPKKRFTGFKDKLKGGIRSEFLDAEAELSGSDYDSADEYEPDEANDIMEQEEGDFDKFNEDDLREEVGRAHMKSMIDKDKRELRLLQELYFEDGDLHGQGRQRKFRWKNMTNNDDITVRESDSEDCEEDDTVEVERRKERIEREKFLQNSNKNDDELDMSINNSSMKIVTNVKKSWNQPKQNVSHARDAPFSLFGLKGKRGSFLSRGQSTLKKLAVLTKENQSLGGVNQGGNFVFQQLSAEEAERMKEKASKQSTNANTVKSGRQNRSFFSLDEKTKSCSIFKHL